MTEPSLDLLDLLREFDGRRVEPFREAAELLPRRPEVVRELWTLADSDEPAVQVGATWVAKELLEQGVAPPEDADLRIARLLDSVEARDAQLHLLQVLSRVEITEASRERLERRLDALRRVAHKFVRAWAYNGFAVLGRDCAAARERALRLFDEVGDDEPASVRARIRHARRELGA